ncbi:DUF2971 domain-containing protein [uncultured Psychromonas sp.]|uniref:DUF2971 domain-containing protein n=1 Tax=uncultured Psychromonas sp. TaxID=173974 RepID=UPI0026250AF6|nr:DUF2971 domain-containing protein [uncultured Psychromonas sp.]
MILYKYYGFNAGLAALRSQRLGFRKPDNFNDPFECTYFSNSDNETEGKIEDKIKEIKKSVDILSLTRTPLNPLMWAHYGEEHTGFVIGYDVDDEFFTSREFNLIPVDEGDVLYTNTKTPTQITNQDVHNIYLKTVDAPFDKEELNNLSVSIRKMFLTKHATWVYEEEVRIVKISDSFFVTSAVFQSHPFRSFNSISRLIAPQIGCNYIDGLKLYTKKQSIKEVFLGVRNPLINSNPSESQVTDNSLKELAQNESWQVYQLSMDSSSWSLKAQETDTDMLKISAKEGGLTSEASLGGKEAEILAQKLLGKKLTDNDKVSVTTFNNEVHVQLNETFI